MLNENVFKVLSLFTGDYQKEVYGREAARELEMIQKSVSNVLLRLENENILRSKIEGRNKVYRLNLSNPALMHILSIVEEEKAVRFRENSGLGRDFVDEILKSKSPLIIIFGSYADGTQKKNSDIDILALSPFDADLSDVQKFYKIKASVKEYTEEELKEALKSGDYLITEVLKKHIVLVGSDLFVKMVLEVLHERR
ncbi:MAG: nucleotidyltransferase domain-containing protein [Thermoplasmata archaeon]|nr:MAG: nucleotidyltransferase domain-containing protein [Thermoplasmata archaeon]